VGLRVGIGLPREATDQASREGVLGPRHRGQTELSQILEIRVQTMFAPRRDVKYIIVWNLNTPQAK
jgi:hypothetical protein